MNKGVPDSEVTRRALDSAYQVLHRSVMRYQGKPVGTVAARASNAAAAPNYDECFVRDFVVSGLVYLADGEPEIVANFLEVALQLRSQELDIAGYEIELGVMPASFRVVCSAERESLEADFGDRAIGRVAPVDAMMWWMILAYAYRQHTGERLLHNDSAYAQHMEDVLRLCVKGSFEVFPTLLVPDGSFMIDRRMGVYGHPLEIQALFYAALQVADQLLVPNERNSSLLDRIGKRRERLQHYVRTHYWIDGKRLNEIHHFGTEEFGDSQDNPLNIYPASLPHWLESWLPDQGGYLAGNLGPGRLDTRFFGFGNLFSIIFGLANEVQSQRIMDLYTARWDDLIGAMPIKLCYPAMEDAEWRLVTGSDPKNCPWSYHNGGNWPVGLWAFVASALLTERRDLAERAVAIAARTLPAQGWPEYYDGRRGQAIGRQANLGQTWSAAGFILAHRLLERPELLHMFPGAQCSRQ